MRYSAQAMRSFQVFGLVAFWPPMCHGFPFFSSAADMGDGDDAAALEPREVDRAEADGADAPVGAIAVENERRRAVEGQVLLVNDRKRHEHAIVSWRPRPGATRSRDVVIFPSG